MKTINTEEDTFMPLRLKYKFAWVTAIKIASFFLNHRVRVIVNGIRHVKHDLTESEVKLNFEKLPLTLDGFLLNISKTQTTFCSILWHNI